MSLKPRNLIQAAKADLARRERNVLRHEGRLSSDVEHYAFHAAHVRRAKNIGQLLEMALKRPGVALKSNKKNTRLIYGDPGLLTDALMIFTTE